MPPVEVTHEEGGIHRKADIGKGGLHQSGSQEGPVTYGVTGGPIGVGVSPWGGGSHEATRRGR